MSPAFGFGLSLEDQNAEMRCMVEAGLLKNYLFRPLKKNKEWQALGSSKCRGGVWPCLAPELVARVQVRRGGERWDAVMAKVGCLLQWRGLRNGGREVGGWVAGHTGFEGGRRVPG